MRRRQHVMRRQRTQHTARTSFHQPGIFVLRVALRSNPVLACSVTCKPRQHQAVAMLQTPGATTRLSLPAVASARRGAVISQVVRCSSEPRPALKTPASPAVTGAAAAGRVPKPAPLPAPSQPEVTPAAALPLAAGGFALVTTDVFAPESVHLLQQYDSGAALWVSAHWGFHVQELVICETSLFPVLQGKVVVSVARG